MRSRAIGLRELARAIGWDASRYQYYEDAFKKPFIPRDLIERISPHIVGKGEPPVTLDELESLSGVQIRNNLSTEDHNKASGVDQKLFDAVAALQATSDSVRDIPILGTVSAGGGSLQMNGEPIDWARRLPRLKGRKDVFGLFIEDLSMLPVYRPGRVVLVERAKPPAPGDDVVVEIQPETPRDELKALIKHLVAITPTVIRLQQYNPAKELEFPRKRVIRMYRVMTMNDLLGV